VKSVSRILGASALIGGVASHTTSVVVVSQVLTQIPTAELPSFVTEEMILGLMGDILAPARTYLFKGFAHRINQGLSGARLDIRHVHSFSSQILLEGL